MDTISTTRLATVHPELRRRGVKLDDMLVADGINFRVTRASATFAEQDALYQRGRTTPGNPCMHGGVVRPVGSCPLHPMGSVVTNAEPLDSMHVYGLAFDGAPDLPGLSTWKPDWDTSDLRWKDFLSKAMTCGLAEGAKWRTFPDSPHFYLEEMGANPDGKMKDLITNGGVHAVWDFVSKEYGF